ncbi:MAG: hypothetical protein AAGA22_08375 [Pseudomonadota bacterium]
MLVSAADYRRNQRVSLTVSLLLLLMIGTAAWFVSPVWLSLFAVVPGTHWLLLRTTRRRWKALQAPDDPQQDAILMERVAYYQRLRPDEQRRFKDLMKVFLSDVDLQFAIQIASTSLNADEVDQNFERPGALVAE